MDRNNKKYVQLLSRIAEEVDSRQKVEPVFYPASLVKEGFSREELTTLVDQLRVDGILGREKDVFGNRKYDVLFEVNTKTLWWILQQLRQRQEKMASVL